MPDQPADLREGLARIIAALRTAPRHRLRATCEGRFASRLDAGRALATALAIATQGIAEEGAASMPAWRSLPVLPEQAIGDQVAVTAHDYLAAVDVSRGRGDAAMLVWTPTGRATLEQLHGEVAALLADVGALW
jgi:hypothetical protein